MNIFLDLEATIIESMDFPKRTEMARNIFSFCGNQIKRNRETKIFIFSFAIHDEEDAKKFLNSGVCIDIENELIFFGWNKLQFQTEDIITKNSLMPSFKKKIRFLDSIDFHDLCNDKELAFQCFCRFDSRVGKNTSNVLIDDMVEDMEIGLDKLNISFMNTKNFLDI